MLRNPLLLVFLSLLVSCDKKGEMRSEHVHSAGVSRTDVFAPVVTLSDVPSTSDVMVIAVGGGGATLSEFGDISAIVIEDIPPVAHVQVMSIVQEGMDKQAETLKHEAEELKKLLKKKQKHLGKKGFDKWKSSRGSHFRKRPPRPRKPERPPRLLDRLREGKK